MSLVAIFDLPCCKVSMIFGRYRGHEMNPPHFTCALHGRQPLKFLRFVDQKTIGRGISDKEIVLKKWFLVDGRWMNEIRPPKPQPQPNQGKFWEIPMEAYG